MATAKEKLIASAQKLVEKGSFDKAIKEYLRVVQEDNADVRIWLKIGDLYFKVGKKVEATETYQRVAQFYSDQGFYLKSVAVYKQILKIDPRLVDVNQRLAELYKQLGLLSDAISQYEQVASFFHKEGKVREALTAMKQIVDLDPEAVAGRIKLAEMYSRENMPREAIDEFTKAAEQLKEQGRVDEYMKVAERLLFHAPDNKPITKELARLYIDKNDPRRALPKLQVLFKADPRDLDVLRLLARAFEGLEQRQKAVSVYKELARILSEQGDNAGTADVFRQILAIQPDDAEAEAALRNVKAGGAPATRRPEPPSSSGAQKNLTSTGPSRAHATGAERALDSGGHKAHETPPKPLRPSSPRDMSAVDSEPVDILSEEIAKILSETDVYIKYNLHAKAIEHLQRVFERQPRHTAAREKLKALFITTGKRDEAILELWALAEGAEPGRARRYVREIYELDPSNARAAQVLGEPVRAPGQAAAERELDAEDDFGVAPPEDFGLLMSSSRPEPATRRGQAVEREIEIRDPSDAVELDEDLLDEADSDALEPYESAPVAVQYEPAAPGVMQDDDDLIPLVIDTGVERQLAIAAPDDDDRFSLDDSDDLEMESGLPPSPSGAYEKAEPDAETRFGGPRGFATPPPTQTTSASDPLDDDEIGFGELNTDEGTGTAQMSMAEVERLAAKELRAPNVAATAHATDQMSAIEMSDLDEAEGGLPHPEPSASWHTPTPEPIGAASSLEDDLDESDFFMQQSLFDEARSMLGSLLERYPNHPLVVAKLRDLEAMELETSAHGTDRGDDTHLADDGPPLERMPSINALSAQLPTDLPGSGEMQAVMADTPSGEPVEVTRRGVIERGVSVEDFETRYDLGIAYKEMGLIDNAIDEFRLVMKDPTREVQCQLMIGLCVLEKQQFTEAINQFKKGLYVEGITDAEALSLYYELGSAYEKIGDPREALYYYDKVQKRDPNFRDLQRRMRALRGEEAPVETPPNASEEVDSAFDALMDEG